MSLWKVSVERRRSITAKDARGNGAQDDCAPGVSCEGKEWDPGWK